MHQKNKDLNSYIETKNKELDKLIKSSDKEKIKIFNKPWKEWKTWVSRLARYNSNKHSIVFMIFGFPIFILILSKYNLLGLQFPTFINVAEIYIYNVFVGPVLQFFDLEKFFKTKMFSFLVSYDYAVLLNKYYAKTFTFSNWMITALPMPILTFLVLVSSYNLQFSRAKNIQPIKCTRMNLNSIYDKFKKVSTNATSKVIDKKDNFRKYKKKGKIICLA